MKQFLLIFCLCLSLMSALQATDNSAPSGAEDFVQQAKQAENRYHYQKALELYRKALAREPNSPQIHLGIAMQLIGMEKLGDAVKHLEKTIQYDPQNAEAHTLLGVYYQKIATDFSQAEQQFKRAIQVDPDYLRPRYLLGELLLSLQRLEEARQVFEAFCLSAPHHFQAHFGLGNVLVKQNQFDQAIAELKRAIEIDPSEPEPYRYLGQALAKMGKRDEAQKNLKLYQEKKNVKNQLKYLLRSVRREPDNAEGWLALGGFYFRQNQPENAIDAWIRGLELDPNRKAIYSYVGVLYLQTRHFESALKFLQRAAELDPTRSDVYNNLGVCHMFLRQYGQAVTAFQKSIELGNKDPRIRKNMEKAYQKMQQSKEQPEAEASP